MATYIKTLKEDNGDITYPQTKAEAVLLNNGSDLETELSQYVTAEDIASTSALTPPVQTNMIADYAVTSAKIADGAVTSDKIDWTTLYIKGADLSGDKAFNSGYTEIQTIALPAGKWLIFWGIRAYFGTNDLNMVTVGLSQNGNVVQSVIVNYSIYQSTARFMQSSICEVTLAGAESYTSFINAPAAGTVSATPSYLFALRVG